MSSPFTAAQLSDIRALRDVSQASDVEIVVIGAAALLLQFENLARYTKDIDVTVALDLEDFEQFTVRLEDARWKHDLTLEHRWRAPSATIVDLLPAGPKLRGEGRITWPQSQFSMSLLGFHHVFRQAISIELEPDVSIKVAPPNVLALLKVVAYLEDPHRRAKDLDDIQLILSRYAENSDRLFSDEVFDAQLSDFGLANALLLGSDLRALGTEQEAAIIQGFFERFGTAMPETNVPIQFAQQCAAAMAGWKGRG